MTNENEYLSYLEDILEAAEKIERFTDGLSREEFRDEEKTATRCFEIENGSAGRCRKWQLIRNATYY